MWRNVAGLADPEKDKAKKLIKGQVKFEIDTGEARPIKQAPRSITLEKRNEVKELVDKKRNNGSTRFCVEQEAERCH